MIKFTIELMKKIHKLYSLIGKGTETNESIIDWDLYHDVKDTPIVIETELNTDDNGRKVKLIQKYLDNVLVPGTELICKATVVRLVNQDEYLIRVWVNKNKKHSQDDLDNIVDDTWDEIYNMFEVPVSVQRMNSEC